MPRYQENPFDPMQVKKHWKEFRPKMYRELKESGKLEQHVQKEIRLTVEDLANLQGQGLHAHQAWPLVRENWLYLPSEEEAPELGMSPNK